MEEGAAAQNTPAVAEEEANEVAHEANEVAHEEQPAEPEEATPEDGVASPEHEEASPEHEGTSPDDGGEPLPDEKQEDPKALPAGGAAGQETLPADQPPEEEDESKLIRRGRTWTSEKDMSLDDAASPPRKSRLSNAGTTSTQVHEEEAVQEGDLVRTVISRHSIKDEVKGRTSSRLSNGSRMSATPSKQRQSTGAHEFPPETPSTNEPDSPYSPGHPLVHERLQGWIDSHGPPPASARPQPPQSPNSSGKQRGFRVPEPVLGAKHGPCGHSVLCLSQYRNSPRHTFQPPYRDEARMNVPGPGQYTPAKAAANDTCAYVSARPESWKENKYPGPRPGSYEVKSYITDGSKRSMGVPREMPGRRGPGPGHYDPQDVPGKGDNYSLGKSRTGRTQAGGSNPNPGPGQYDHACYHAHLRSKSPQYSIKTAVQREKDPRYEQRPGPTHYDKATTIGYGAKVSHGMPHTGPKGHNFPGPGHYAGHLSTFHLS